MADQVKRVIVVRKKVEPVEKVQESHKKPYSKATIRFLTKAAQRHEAKMLRQNGCDYFGFFFNVEKFVMFAEKCHAQGIKPNEYVWGLIKKDMGWTE